MYFYNFVELKIKGDYYVDSVDVVVLKMLKLYCLVERHMQLVL